MVTWGNKQFYIDGKPFKIHSGAIHYFRSMPEKWPELLLKLKNCGLNTVETYCPWNLHEENEGQFDFSGRLDVVRFVELAKEIGLYVIIRPGPFICAEWEFGGMPAWLLKDCNFRFRTDDGEYLTYAKKYFDKLIPLLLPLMETRGGNIIMFGAENEYGSFGASEQYMNKCADLLKSYGIDVPIITSDGSTKGHLNGGHAQGCLRGMDFGYSGEVCDDYFDEINEIQPDAPIFRIEFWEGIFSSWGKPHKIYEPEKVEAELRTHLKRGDSFNLYMFHGGTNFGFTNGSRYVTSYDYDALLTEWGEITPKYLLVQKAMSEYLGVELPQNRPVPLMSLGDIPLTASADLFENLDAVGKKHLTPCQHHMEYYGQNFGYILYRTKITPAADNITKLFIDGLADRANVYFNGVLRATVCGDDNQNIEIDVDGWMNEGGTLDILVENQGRANIGPKTDHGDRKGILEHVRIYYDRSAAHILYNWEVYTLPMNDLKKLNYSGATSKDKPTFYKGSFRTEKKDDCFIHLENFTKGFVFVNGFNLGRYWEIGPQLSLYLPGSLLKDENEIIVFDEVPTENPVVSIRDYHILDAEVKTAATKDPNGIEEPF